MCASLLEILLNRAIYPVNLHNLSIISSELAHFLKYFVHFLWPVSYKLYNAITILKAQKMPKYLTFDVIKFASWFAIVIKKSNLAGT